jgi:hypothetical protein
LLYHLAPGGYIILNVPAVEWVFSEYDRAAGHVRRYSIRTLRDAVESTNLSITNWTYWGMPLLPSLLLRKLWLIGRQKKDEIISAGFDSRNNSINRLLGLLANCELIPQKLIGTSLMVVLRLRSQAEFVRQSD